MLTGEPESAPAPEPETRSVVWLVMRVVAFGLVGALLALLIWRVVAARRGSALVANVRANRKPMAPDFNLPVLWKADLGWPPAARGAINDGRLQLHELRGYPVVLNFWASWCIPCKAEAPRLVASANRHQGQVLFVAVDVQDFKSDARAFLRRFRTNYPSVRDGGSSTYSDYGLTGLPETFFIDRQGRAVSHSIGEVSTTELEAGVALVAGGGSP